MSTGRAFRGSGSCRSVCGSELTPWARFAGCLTLGIIVASNPGSSVEPGNGEGVWAGVEAVDLTGDVWTASTLLDRVVLVDFWATWCPPCLAELPNLRRIHQELAGEDLVILGVSLNTTHRRSVRSFLLRHDMAWPQIHDGRGLEGALGQRFGVEAVPRTVVVDREGRLVAVDLRGEALYTVLRDLTQPAPGYEDGGGVPCDETETRSCEAAGDIGDPPELPDHR